MSTKLSLGALLLAISTLATAAKPIPQHKTADFNGIKLHYQTLGSGPKALVFVHGWTCNSDFWRQSMAEFPGYRTIALDLPGHGQSDKPQTNYTMDYFARGVAAVLRDAKVKQAVLVGHSMGTPVIRQFYRLYPQQTLGLVVVDGSLRPIPRAEVEPMLADLRADYRSNAEKTVEGMLTPIRDEALKQEIRSAMLGTPDHVGRSAIEGILEEKVWSTDKIAVPVLAIIAQAPVWKPDTEAYFRSLAPNLEFHMWQDVSHFLMMERAEEFNRLVGQFVAKHELL